MISEILYYILKKPGLYNHQKNLLRTYRRLEKLTASPGSARPTSQQLIYIYKLDRKNVLFFSLEENYLILLSIYPYKKDITRSKYY